MLIAVILASSLSFIDGSVVNVGLPAIGRSFPASVDSLQWVINAYLLPLSALLLLGGAAGDRFGRRRLLIWGTVLFALASIGCAAAPNLETLLASRLAQGAGAALLMPNSLAILGAYFSGEAKGRAVGIWAAAGAIVSAIGPVLGGWIIDLGNWRAIFVINLPLAVLIVAVTRRSVPESFSEERPALDIAGAALATAALGCLTFALTWGAGRAGWTSGASIALLLSVGFFFGFGAVERARGLAAMLPLKIFGSSTFVGLTLLTLLLYAALGGLSVLIPYVLIQATGYSGTAAGAALLPLPIVLALLSPRMGALSARIGARTPLVAGSVVVAAGFALSLRIHIGGDYWQTVFPCIFVTALGLSAAVTPLTTAVLTSVDAAHTGAASGLNNAVARAGGLIAIAMLGKVLSAQGQQLINAFHIAMLAGAALCLAAALSAWAMVRKREKSGRPALTDAAE